MEGVIQQNKLKCVLNATELQQEADNLLYQEKQDYFITLVTCSLQTVNKTESIPRYGAPRHLP